MNTVRRLAAESAPSAPAEPHVASWYTQGRSDGLGDRLLMFDNTNAASLELLRFRSPLSATREFESALRDRLRQLSRFDHPAFPAVRAVEHLDDGGGLALVSAHIPGRRLSEMFQGPQPRAGLHPAFVTWLIRQLASALSALQSEGENLFHGALTADRIIVSADGHLLIAEHVLGSALQGLRLTPSRLSQEFGILAPGTRLGGARMDVGTDVAQLGLIALSVLLGRQLSLEAYQHDLASLLDEFSTSARQRSPFLAPPLRLWLERALQLGDHPFRSAADSCTGLKELPETTTPHGFAPVQARLPVDRGQKAVPAAPPPEANGARGQAESSTAAPSPADIVSQPSQPPQQPVAKGRPAVRGHGAEPAGRVRSGDLAEEDEDEEEPLPVFQARRSASPTGLWLGGLTLTALLEAVVIGRLLVSPTPSTPSPQMPILIESPRPGDIVMVDGRPSGTTPLTITVGPETRAIQVVPANPTPPALKAADPGPEPARTKGGPPAGEPSPAPSRPRSGGVRLVSPIELQVFENERFLGSSVSGPIVTSPGVHELELVNTDLGYRTFQRVTITEGQLVNLTIAPPTGRVSINAVPWAQVWIDGRAAGETPLADVSIAAGQHTVTFRHPDYGERTETVTVRPGEETRVSTTLRP